MPDERDTRDRDVYVGVTRGAGSGRHRLVTGAVFDGRSTGTTTRMLIGVVLVFFGLLWTVDNLGWTAAGEVMRWWPVLVLLYGIMRLVGSGVRRSTLQGVFFTLVGGLLVIARIADVSVGLGIAFPLLMILGGIGIVRRTMLGERFVRTGESAEEVIRLTAVMGGVSSRGVGTDVRRGELCAVMGGIVLDLREAQPAEGRMTIDTCACLGGIEIIVPETWRVESEIAPIVGGFDDQTQRVSEGPPACTLLLTGTAILGGVVARNHPASDREVHITRRRRRRGMDDVREVHVGPTGITVKRGGKGDVRIDPFGVHVSQEPPAAPPDATPGPPPGAPPPVEPR